MGFGCFIFALVRAYAPKLTIMSVFGTIAIDIFCVSEHSHVATLSHTPVLHRASVRFSRSHSTPSSTPC